jgi:hypothetical protein
MFAYLATSTSHHRTFYNHHHHHHNFRMIPKESANMADPTGVQEEIKDRQGVLTEQKKIERKARMAFLDAIEIGRALASSVDIGVIGQSRTPLTSTLAPTLAPTLGTSGVPITKTVVEEKLATLVLADCSGEEASATSASSVPSVRRVSRKQRPVTPVATGGSSNHVPVACRPNARAPASNSKQAVVKAIPAADSTGSLRPGLDKIREAATARSTPTPHSTIDSVPTTAPRHTPSITSSNNLQRAPAATATREPEKGREAQEKTLKKRKDIDLALRSHPPHQNQTTAQDSAPLSEDLHDPIVFRVRTLEKKKDNDVFFEDAATRLRRTEIVVATVDHKKSKAGSVTAVAPQQSPWTPPSNDKGRKVPTEQDEKELVDEIQSSFTALDIGSVLGSSFNVPGWQPPKNTPGVATVVPDKGNLFGRMPEAHVFAFQAKPLPELKVAAIPSSFKIGPTKLQPPAKAGVTDVPEHLVFIPTLKSTLEPMPMPRTQSNVSSMPSAANFAFRAKPLPELKIAAIPSSLNTGISPYAALVATSTVSPKLTLKGQSYFVRLPTTSDFSFQGPSSYKTRRVNAALAAARSNRIGKYAHRSGAALLHSPLDVKIGSTSGLASAMSKMAIGTQPGNEAPDVSIAKATPEQKSVTSIVTGDSGKQGPATPASSLRRATRKRKLVAPVTVAGGLASATTPTHKDTTSAPSLIVVPSRPGGFPPASSRAKAPMKGDNPGKALSAKAAPIHLFTLPQELQDSIFEFAYTEPNFKAVSKVLWEVRQDRLRKSTGTPRVAFPPPKVNEWMVSKRYFRSAASAWVGAQTSLDRIQNGERSLLATERCSVGYNSALFHEFGTAFQISMPRFFGSRHAEPMLQCRKMRHLICLVSEEFLGETDRGFAWEVEFTDEEMIDSLNRVNFKLPWRVETLQVRPQEHLLYTDTEAKKAVLVANLVNLQRLMWQRKLREPHAATAEDEDGALYLGSKVSCRNTRVTYPPKKAGRHPGSKKVRKQPKKPSTRFNPDKLHDLLPKRRKVSYGEPFMMVP